MTPPRPAARLVVAVAIACTIIGAAWSSWPPAITAAAWLLAVLRVGMLLEHREWESLPLAVIVEDAADQHAENRTASTVWIDAEQRRDERGGS